MAESSSLKYPPRFIQSPLNSQYPESIQHENQGKSVPSYLEATYVTPRTRILCEIISNTPPPEVENALISSGITPNSVLVEDVLKLSYGNPSGAVSFFRWAGFAEKPSVCAWNLMVDLLGKNEMFDEMWGAIRSMNQEGFVSLATFESVFKSYCLAGRFEDAIMSFDVLGKYGIEPNLVAVNSLLSAICREENQTQRAFDFFEKIKVKVPPNGHTYTILLEGWEKEGNVAKAKTTFGEMVIRVGWDTKNMDAYNAFLTTLVRGCQLDEVVKFLHVMKGKGCLPGSRFFSVAFDILFKKNYFIHAVKLWDTMVGSGIMPNLITYNSMIGLFCNKNDIDNAFHFLDEMPFYGVFPDSTTYNMIFECLVNTKKVHEVGSFFKEMIKNEYPPTHANCSSAIKMLFDQDDPETGIEIWNHVLENKVMPIDESANALLIGLCKINRFSELKRFAIDMLDERILIHESTMEKLQKALYKEGRKAIYDSLERRWKASNNL